MAALECGHPAECLYQHEYDDEPYCAWCENIRYLQNQIDALNSAIEGKAFIVTGGVLQVDGPISYLSVGAGGTVICGGDAPVTLSPGLSFHA